MKKIKLTKGLFAIVDDDIFNFLNKWKWQAVGLKKRPYAARSVKNPRTMIYLHRFITMAQPLEYIDHKNRDTLDNRLENLRFCTNGQNMTNSFRNKNLSGMRGVSKSRKRFFARIRHKNKSIYIGHYKTVKEAAKAYDKMAKKLHGEFAQLNYP